METIIDTVSLQHLLRSPKRQISHSNATLGTSLDRHIAEGKIIVVLDEKKVILNEWEKTCGIDHIHVLVTHWAEINGLKFVTPAKGLGRGVGRYLATRGFNDTIDKFLIRVAIVTNDRKLVSEDGDFWDPRDINRKGDNDAPIARYLKDTFCIDVFLLGQLFESFEKA